ncbi:hypothetical protein GCM10007386_27850 [Pseudoduganella dura]|nr:hypothetical protein GCM10007386_27850 [Pseudoduganella dura]
MVVTANSIARMVQRVRVRVAAEVAAWIGGACCMGVSCLVLYVQGIICFPSGGNKPISDAMHSIIELLLIKRRRRAQGFL